MADNEKNYTSKVKIGNVVYYIKDSDAQAKLAVLNGAKGVEGSVATSVYEQAKNAFFEDIFTATGAAIKVGDFINDNGTWVEITSENIETYAESTPYAKTGYKTIAEAIEDAAASIGNLTVNGVSPDANDAIVINSGDIKREDGVTTLELSFTTLESDVTTLKGSASTEGSVKYTVKTEAKDADYSTGTPATYKAATEYDNSVTYYSDANGTVADPQPTDQDDITAYYVVDTPAVQAKTIGQAIAANTTAISGLDTRVTSLEGTRTTLLGDDTVTGSIDNRIKTQAGDATTQLTAGGSDTTITAAIQSLQTQVNNTNKGQFKVIYAVDQANGTITEEEGDTPVAVSAANLGYIYLVASDSADTKSVYTEYIVVNQGTESTPDFIIEKIGDTDLSLSGYATEAWVTANAKNGSYSTASDATYKAATEYDPNVTYYSDDQGTVADPQPDDTSTISNYYVVDTPAVAAQTIAQAIAANTTNIANEVARATEAEAALDTRIDTLEEDSVKSVNGVTVTSGTNNVEIDSTDIDHTYNTNVVTYEESATQTVAVGKYVYVDSEYVEVTADNLSDYSEYSGTVYEKVTTPTPTTVTVAQRLEAINTAVANETTRATGAEDALDSRIDQLEEYVNGETITSVNGHAATAQNNGVIVLDPSDLVYKEAGTETVGVWVESYGGGSYESYVKADLSDTAEPSGTAGTPVELGTVDIGSEKDTYMEEGVWYTKSGGNWYEVTGLTSSAFTLGSQVTDSDTIAELEADTADYCTISYVPYTVPTTEVTVEDALDNIFSKLSVMSGSSASAVTNVGVRSGTGTWAVDNVDPEQLNWTDIQLEVETATFLTPSS